MSAPPPPPPPGPPPPMPPPPTTNTSSSSSGNGPAVDFTELVKNTVKEVDAIIPVRPRTPPDFGPEKFYDVETFWLTPKDFYNRLQFGSQMLVIDVRSKELFEKDHIRSAISVDWEQLSDDDMLTVEKQVKERFYSRRNFAVFVYDEESTKDNVKPTLSSFVEALVKERRTRKGVFILNGGIKAFKERHAFLTTGDPSFGDYEFPSEIEDAFIYLGNFETAANLRALQRLGITHVVNATDSCDMPHSQHVKYLHCPLDDHPDADISQFFQPFFDFVEDARKENGRVLIHCKMGMSRSPTLAILWAMKSRNLNLQEATEFVRNHRLYINPNPGFLKQLADYEEKTLGNRSIRFPDGEELTVGTIYEWRQPDGTWKRRTLPTDFS